MEFDFYYGAQADQFAFIRVPRQLLLNQAFSGLSIQAKMLYAVLLDRMSLSLKNHWLDSENRVYIIYQVEEIMQDLGFTKRKALDVLSELEEFGLITRKRRGRGLPNYLYMRNFISGLADSNLRQPKSENTRHKTIAFPAAGRRSETAPSESSGHRQEGAEMELLPDRRYPDGQSADRSGRFSDADQTDTAAQQTALAAYSDSKTPVQTRRGMAGTHAVKMPAASQEGAFSALQEGAHPAPQEGAVSAPLMSYTEENYTERNQTEKNQNEHHSDIHQSIVSIRRDVMDRIGYEILAENYGRGEIDGIVDLIAETLASSKATLVIGGETIAADIVKERFSRLDMFHIEYVLDCMRETMTKIRNIRQYLLTALYNAPSTMPHYYTAEVNHNMYGRASGKESRV